MLRDYSFQSSKLVGFHGCAAVKRLRTGQQLDAKLDEKKHRLSSSGSLPALLLKQGSGPAARRADGGVGGLGATAPWDAKGVMAEKAGTARGAGYAPFGHRRLSSRWLGV